MRFLCLAFVLSVSASAVVAQDAIAPEVFAACEAKFPSDFKQQLACVKEQSAAAGELDGLKKPANRQIVVKPKPETVIDDGAAEETKSSAAPQVNQIEADTLEQRAAQAFCDGEHGGISGSDSWKRCMADEAKARDLVDDALATLNSDIAGDPILTCQHFTQAFQPPGHGYHLSQKRMLNCLKAKKPTLAFARCYESYVGERYTRDIQSVPERHAKDVAHCFNADVGRG
jgi:hypothetical protein